MPALWPLCLTTDLTFHFLCTAESSASGHPPGQMKLGVSLTFSVEGVQKGNWFSLINLV